MKTNLVLAAALIAMPLESRADEEPPPQDFSAIAACVVLAAVAAVGAVYIISRGCKPKYYWIMDNDEPPKFWVGTATRKERDINDWKFIGGPYDKPGDAPGIHPDPTNRVESVISAPVHIQIQESTNLVTWTTAHSEFSDLEDFSYALTNTGVGQKFYRGVIPWQ